MINMAIYDDIAKEVQDYKKNLALERAKRHNLQNSLESMPDSTGSESQGFVFI